jgi:hypothetical protein
MLPPGIADTTDIASRALRKEMRLTSNTTTFSNVKVRADAFLGVIFPILITPRHHWTSDSASHEG